MTLVMLNRPNQLNAWSWRMSDEFSSAFNEADEDEDVRAIVVTGAGRAFCAGADLSGGGGTFADESEVVARRPRETERQRPAWDLSTPVIAAINGPAVGAGLTMAIEWDLLAPTRSPLHSR